MGHRLTRVKNREQIELKVKWQDYSEPTWESFTGFVKDASAIVERYLLRKSLMKPLQEYIEMKKVKKAQEKRKNDMLVYGATSEGRPGAFSSNSSVVGKQKRTTEGKNSFCPD